MDDKRRTGERVGDEAGRFVTREEFEAYKHAQHAAWAGALRVVRMAALQIAAWITKNEPEAVR